jgi:hypothetical protein
MLEKAIKSEQQENSRLTVQRGEITVLDNEISEQSS